MIVLENLTDKSKDNFEWEGKGLLKGNPTNIIEFGDLTLKCYEKYSSDFVLIERDEAPLGYLALNKINFYITGFQEGLEDRTIFAYVPHMHLEPELRGKGLGPRLYRWINEKVPLVSNYQHSKMASGMWHKLIETQPTRVLHSQWVHDNSYTMELKHDIDPHEIMLEPGFHVMLNYKSPEGI